MPPDEGQAVWLLSLFAFSVGLPFFAISANAPLLQHWFSRSGHAQSHDPIFSLWRQQCRKLRGPHRYPLLIEP